MSYATYLWGVFEPKKGRRREHLLAVGSSRSETKRWQRQYAPGAIVRRLAPDHAHGTLRLPGVEKTGFQVLSAELLAKLI